LLKQEKNAQAFFRQQRENAMSNQPSRREDGFGTAGTGEDDDSRMGQRGHASQGGTANPQTGGAQGRQKPPGNEANKQGVDEAPLDVNEPAKR
jgi:hypothetical protein